MAKHGAENLARRTVPKYGSTAGNTKATTVKFVLVEPSDASIDESIQMLYRNGYPELTESTEDFAVLKQKSNWKLRNDTLPTQKVIKINQGDCEEDLWHKLNMLKEETKEDRWVALHHLEKCSVERLRKMAEAIFHGGDTQVTIFTNRMQKNAPASSYKIGQDLEELACAGMLAELARTVEGVLTPEPKLWVGEVGCYAAKFDKLGSKGVAKLASVSKSFCLV
ncbi:unnamed protein product [Ceutorhynchus assimilis]|uniref:Uncharacterized protein n=1 Tax=Ceutorhynchus assimilis TaxID=467358 RepID=A0A9N9QSN7_9CUCU|nr:unnamed protein product [Ceutorhynchus assimilis]